LQSISSRGGGKEKGRKRGEKKKKFGCLIIPKTKDDGYGLTTYSRGLNAPRRRPLQRVSVQKGRGEERKRGNFIGATPAQSAWR